MVKNIGKFETALRARKYPVADGLLIGLNQRQDNDWDKFDDLTILHLYLRVISVYDHTATSFDWDTNFTASIFRSFEEIIPTSIPDIAPQTLPTKSTATNVNTPDLHVHHAPDITANNGISPNIASTSCNDTPGLDADSAYSHVYHYDALRADKTDHHHRTGTDNDSNVPTPHPLWQSSDIAKAVDINIKEFLNMTLAPLLTSDPEAIREFHRSLTRQATASNIDLCPLDYFEQTHALWPKNLPVPIVLNMKRFLLLKLEQHDAINRTDAVLKLLCANHITLGNSKLSAYHFLHALLQLAHNAHTGCLVALPCYKDTMDVVKFAEKLLWYCHNELSMNLPNITYKNSTCMVSWSKFNSLSSMMYLLMMKFPSPCVMHNWLSTSLPLPAPWIYYPALCPSLIVSAMSTKGRTSRDTSRDGPFRQFEDVQCKAHSIWGHSVKNCSGLAKIATVHEYITAHPAHAATAVTTWRDLHIENHQTAKAHSLHALTDSPANQNPPSNPLDLSALYQADFQ
jgi:hypothetical protein